MYNYPFIIFLNTCCLTAPFIYFISFHFIFGSLSTPGLLDPPREIPVFYVQNFSREQFHDFDFSLQYHPGKENVVDDALSRKSRSILSCLMAYEWKMYDYISEFHPCFDGDEPKACFYTLVAQPTVLLRVIEAQRSDKNLEDWRNELLVFFIDPL